MSIEEKARKYDEIIRIWDEADRGEVWYFTAGFLFANEILDVIKDDINEEDDEE